MASDTILELTDSNFDVEVLKSDQPVLVDFWAEWCQPCRMLTPTIEEIGDTAVFLLSDMSSAITGEVIYVDCGFHMIGF